jgi:hypothetical protein
MSADGWDKPLLPEIEAFSFRKSAAGVGCCRGFAVKSEMSADICPHGPRSTPPAESRHLASSQALSVPGVRPGHRHEHP